MPPRHSNRILNPRPLSFHQTNKRTHFIAYVEYKTSNIVEKKFSDISVDAFFTAETFPAAGYETTKQLYYKRSFTRVLNLEDQDVTTVKGTDVITGVSFDPCITITVE